MTAIQLIEKLKEVDPFTEVVIAAEDCEVGYHFKKFTSLEEKVVRMTKVGGRWELMSCPIEKPNAFKALVLR